MAERTVNMAHKHWKHYCSVTKMEEYQGEEICPECNQRGEYAGYRLSVVEQICSYAVRTKLAPFGPHRQFADTLLEPFFKKCPNCDGQGLVDVSEEDYIEIKYGHDGTVCPVCRMGKYLFDGPPEEFEAVRKQVLTAYPGVESPKNSKRVIPTTEPASEPPPPPSEPKQSSPISPSASPQAFFTRPAGKSKKDLKKMAGELADAIGKHIENERNFQISDHRSKYTYLLRRWQKRGGTFRVRTDGIELRAISHPSLTLGVLFIESPYVASVILDREMKDLGLDVRDIGKFQISIPRPEQFSVVRGSAYLPIDDSFTQPMFDQLLDALVELDKALPRIP
jgi:hypothetical protein